MAYPGWSAGSMTSILLPNIEALLSAFLRNHDAIIDLVGDRVYTVIPSHPDWPLIRVGQYDDQPAGQRPLHHVAYMLQVEAFGGSKAQAFTAANTARVALAADLPGTHAQGIVSGVDTRGMTDLPDESYSPAKPRWLFSATVYAHPPKS